MHSLAPITIINNQTPAGVRRKPKRPAGAFFWFQRDPRNKVKVVDFSTQQKRVKKLAELWRSLTPYERAPYEE